MAKWYEKFFSVKKINEPDRLIGKGEKQKNIQDELFKSGVVSNIGAVNGIYGFRTSRLPTIISRLRKNKGMVIETKIILDDHGNYVDCVYTFAGLSAIMPFFGNTVAEYMNFDHEKGRS